MALRFKLDENIPGEAVALTADEQVSRRLWVIEPGRLRIKE